MDPHFAGINLNASDKTECFLFVKEKCSQFVMSTIVQRNLWQNQKPFKESLFDSIIVNDIEPIDWGESQTTANNNESVKNDSVI